MNIIITLIILVFSYHITYKLFLAKNYFPSFYQIIETLFISLTNQEIYIHIISSLMRVVIGFLIACIFGILLGILLAYFKCLKSFKSFIEILQPIPPIAWIPIAIILFGLGNNSAYFVVFLGAFFPIFTNTYFGAASIPKIYKNTAASFEISKIEYFKKILFFYSLPHIFTGLKIGIGMAWMSVIAAELIGSQSGLGYYIQLNRLLLQTENILVGMIMIGLIGFLLKSFIEYLENKIIKWI